MIVSMGLAGRNRATESSTLGKFVLAVLIGGVLVAAAQVVVWLVAPEPETVRECEERLSDAREWLDGVLGVGLGALVTRRLS